MSSPDTELEAAFVRACREAAAGLQAVVESEVEKAQRQLRVLGRELVALDRRILAATRRGLLYREAGDDSTALAREYRRLLSLSEAREVGTEGTVVYLVTEPLLLEHGGRRHRLGRFRLELDLTGDVRVHSLDRLGARSLWDHPHVQMGIPCLGNVREGMLKLIAEFELSSAARVLLNFLHVYNPQTAYGPIELWPQAE